MRLDLHRDRGDGFLQAVIGEVCDDGDANSNSGACTLLCQPASCGDGSSTAMAARSATSGGQRPRPGCNAQCLTTVATPTLAPARLR
ncbi:MAG: hypothetical protein R3B09_04630 [Nannocystaceae bacterium]